MEKHGTQHHCAEYYVLMCLIIRDLMATVHKRPSRDQLRKCMGAFEEVGTCLGGSVSSCWLPPLQKIRPGSLPSWLRVLVYHQVTCSLALACSTQDSTTLARYAQQDPFISA